MSSNLENPVLICEEQWAMTSNINIKTCSSGIYFILMIFLFNETCIGNLFASPWDYKNQFYCSSTEEDGPKWCPLCSSEFSKYTILDLPNKLYLLPCKVLIV